MVMQVNRRTILVVAIAVFVSSLVYLHGFRQVLDDRPQAAAQQQKPDLILDGVQDGFAKEPVEDAAGGGFGVGGEGGGHAGQGLDLLVVPVEDEPGAATGGEHGDGGHESDQFSVPVDEPLEEPQPVVEAQPVEEDAQPVEEISTPALTYTKAVVMGKLNEDKYNTDWVHELEDWAHYVYIVDLDEGANSSTGYRTKMNRAHEAMPYLTYIVEHYPDFPDVVAFVHPHRGGRGAHASAWHTDAPLNDAVAMLSTLRADTVSARGYVNLRCIDAPPGCPDEIQPWRDPPNKEKAAEHVFPYFYAGMFNLSLPQVKEKASVVAQPCCAQFAVSRQQLLARPKAEYEHFVRFLEATVQDGYEDETAGRVMEYMWHIIFGRDHVFCPPTVECYCDVYGRFCPP